MSKTTKAQLAKDLDYYSKESSLLHCILNDLVNGKVRWFRKGSQALGISRATGAAGALVIHRSKSSTFVGDVETRSQYSCAYFWETWFPAIKQQSCHSSDKDGADLREIAWQAHNWILNQQN